MIEKMGLCSVNAGELVAFVLYFVLVIGVGIYFYIKEKGQSGEKQFFIGGRKMSGIVSALSAGASDMSAWVLMGLPGAIYLYGMGQVWISIGLVIGTALAWVFVAPRLRRYSIIANDSITIPQYLTNRFLSHKSSLQITCAIIFMIVYCVYGASSISACGTLFNTLFGLDARIAMAVATVVIILYVFLGGFNAVCWTDFFQGMIMLVALMITPFVALGFLNADGPVAAGTIPDNFYNFMSSGKFDWESIATMLTGLSWGLGYFGMPHIIIRYISIKSEREMKKSQKIGTSWTTVILIMATVVAIVARKFLGDSLVDGNYSSVFIITARTVFPAFIGGLIITAVIAASMSTADSQLLASSSSFASDIYKTAIKKDATDKQVLWVGRIVVILISLIAFLLAFLGSGEKPIVKAFSTIMSLVSAAWAAFGSAFGPVILFSLYWRRFNYKGAISSIIVGFVVDILWMILFNFEYYGMESVIFNTGLYEIIPGFIAGTLTAVIVSLTTEAPTSDITKIFDIVDNAKSVEVVDDVIEVVNKDESEKQLILGTSAVEVTTDAFNLQKAQNLEIK